MGSTKAHTYSSSQLQILLRRNPLALWAIYLFAGQGKYRPIGENLREAAMKMSYMLASNQPVSLPDSSSTALV